MFERIDKKLKWVARIIYWVSLVGGGIWFINLLKSYVDLAMYHIPFSLIEFINPIVIILSGIVTSYLFYGFGELISHVRNIDCGLKGSIKTVDEVEGNADSNKI